MVDLRAADDSSIQGASSTYSVWFNLAFWQGRPSITFVPNSHGAGSIAECAAVLG
jgi:hypothetical protein